MNTKEEQLAEDITNSINSMLFDEVDFTKAMSNQHRTLQQKFTKLCFAWIEKMANTEPRFTDARNQASAEISKKVIDAFHEKMIEEHAVENKELLNPSRFLPNI